MSEMLCSVQLSTSVCNSLENIPIVLAMCCFTLCSVSSLNVKILNMMFSKLYNIEADDLVSDIYCKLRACFGTARGAGHYG